MNSLRIISDGQANTTEHSHNDLTHVHDKVDALGAGLSFLCAIHCLLMPFIIGILPLIGLGFLAEHTAEEVFVGCSVLLALCSLCWGFKKHGKLHGIIVLAIAIGLLVSGLYIAHDHSVFLVAGATCIALAHLVNKRLCHTCKSCESHTSCCT
jgi:hypothetical protein